MVSVSQSRKILCVIKDARGKLLTVEYFDGNSVEYQLEDDGRVIRIVDTLTGSRIQRISDEEFRIRNLDGTNIRIEGTVSVEQDTGDVSVRLKDGTTIVINPDGTVRAPP